MSLEDLERRVGALEERMDVEEGLRASQDRDLATLEQRTKAMMQSLQAISLTVSEHSTILREHGTILREHGTILREHGTILRDHGERLNRIEGTLDDHTQLHGVTHGKLDLIVTILDRLSGNGQN